MEKKILFWMLLIGTCINLLSCSKDDDDSNKSKITLAKDYNLDSKETYYGHWALEDENRKIIYNVYFNEDGTCVHDNGAASTYCTWTFSNRTIKATFKDDLLNYTSVYTYTFSPYSDTRVQVSFSYKNDKYNIHNSGTYYSYNRDIN